MELLDNQNMLRDKDPSSALGVIAKSPSQLSFAPQIKHLEKKPDQKPEHIVLAGMGGSALAGKIAKSWLDLPVPFEIVNDYDLPNFVNEKTLVICFSVSGNTEETLSALADAERKKAQIVVISQDGALEQLASEKNLPYIKLDPIAQPRYGTLMHLRTITKILYAWGFSYEKYLELEKAEAELEEIISSWGKETLTATNFAKQLALKAVGKTPIIYASNSFWPLAYQWKISFNENAKNTAFYGVMPEMCHNEFIGWTGLPVEKPFAIFDLRSKFDHERTKLRFEIVDRLLSGQRPKAVVVELPGSSILLEFLSGVVLGNFVSIYTGILNGVNPTPVEAVEKLKAELVK
jgi:glucose/mannose-6-phosphate isomerase